MRFIGLKASDSCWAKCWCYHGLGRGSFCRVYRFDLETTVISLEIHKLGSSITVVIVVQLLIQLIIIHQQCLCFMCFTEIPPPSLVSGFQVILAAVVYITRAAFDFQAASFPSDSAKWSKLDHFGLIRAWSWAWIRWKSDSLHIYKDFGRLSGCFFWFERWQMRLAPHVTIWILE